MKQRALVLVSGAAGILLAALFYFVALQLQGALKFLLLIPEAGFIIFFLLLGISFVEIGAMTFALIRFARQFPLPVVCLVAAGYVSFSGLYAIGYAVLVPDTLGIQILVALCLVRWLTLWWVRLSPQVPSLTQRRRERRNTQV